MSLGPMSPTGLHQFLDIMLVKGSQEQQEKTTSEYNCLSDVCVTSGNVPPTKTKAHGQIQSPFKRALPQCIKGIIVAMFSNSLK